ncbi:MAG: hypothetical protein QW331_04490 [Candidatus Woesearchaeota archaeon]
MLRSLEALIFEKDPAIFAEFATFSDKIVDGYRVISSTEEYDPLKTNISEEEIRNLLDALPDSEILRKPRK